MATSRGSKQRTTFNAAGQARVEQAAHLAGMADAFAQAAEMGPQVLALQQALLRGMVQSQRQEAERLAARYGDDYGRIADAKERAERFEAMQAEWGERAQGLGRVVETFKRDGLFHGYVSLADGTPAAGCTVRLEWMAADQKRPRRGQAKTDGAGYFRIELEGGGDGDEGQGKERLKRWAERFASMAEPGSDEGDESDTAASASAAATGGTEPGAAAPASRVTVHDASGAQVFEDPSPPNFEATASEFRYYVVDEARAGQGQKGRKMG